MGFFNIVPSITNNILSLRLKNDYITENTFFDLKFELDRSRELDMCINILYRLLWEDMYLRRYSPIVGSYVLVKDNFELCLRISLSEAIDFIRQITPPIFRERTMESLDSIDNVMSMVDFYLKDKNAHDYKYRIDMLLRCLQMNVFDTRWDYDNKRFDVIKSKFMTRKSNLIGVVDYSDKPVTELKELGSIDGHMIECNIQMSLRMSNIHKNPFCFVRLFSFLRKANSILNVKYEIESDTMYLSLYDSYVYKKWGQWFSFWYENV